MSINGLDMYKWRPDVIRDDLSLQKMQILKEMMNPPVHQHSIHDPGHTHQATTQRAPMTPLQMINMRLFRGTKEGQKVLPFQYIDAYVDEKTAVVFMVIKDKPVTIEDDVGLFPSDNLITQLRLLIG